MWLFLPPYRLDGGTRATTDPVSGMTGRRGADYLEARRFQWKSSGTVASNSSTTPSNR
jgi:hypothetical protein